MRSTTARYGTSRGRRRGTRSIGGRLVTINPETRPAIEPVDVVLDGFVGQDTYSIDTLYTDLHRLVFLLGLKDGQQLFGEPTP